MKVAICYDNLYTKGGHEKVILTLTKAFNADIYTIKYEAEKTFQEFKNYNIYENKLKYNISGFKLLETIHKYRNLDLSNYDIIISNGGWSRQVAVNKNNHCVIDYNPGPPGFMKYEHYSRHPIKKHWLSYIKKLEIQAIENVDCLILNSIFVKSIFEKYCKSKTVKYVIYPPINLRKFENKKAENYYLSVQRIIQVKRVDLQVKIFTKLNKENLIILGSVGDKEYLDKLLKTATKNINVITDLSNEKVAKMYSKCKGVIQTGEEEPFGIVAIEAMASGKPCIAVNEGGFKETIINKKTGLLINPPYIDNFRDAIQKFDSYSFNPKICQERAMEFSEEAFIEKIKNIINKVVAAK